MRRSSERGEDDVADSCAQRNLRSLAESPKQKVVDRSLLPK